MGVDADHHAAIKEADIVSFDLFDTLVVRNLARPADAFRLAQELFNERTRWYLTDELAPYRVAAEIALRNEAVAEGLSADSVTMDDIYRRVADLAMLDQEMANALLDAELDTERLVLRPVPGMVALLQLAIDEGKTVLVVSDTYLPSDFVSEVLTTAGVPGGYELWVSSERGLSKADGSAWAAVVHCYPDRRIVHFGDNEVSDVIHPRAFGITAIPLTNAAQMLRLGLGDTAPLNGPWLFDHLGVDQFRLKNVHRSMLAGVVANRLEGSGTTTPEYAVGYGAFGPLLLGYVQWLHRAATTAGYDHLFFLARDGQVMERAYAAYWGDERLPSTYLWASRRLLNVAAIGPSLSNRDVDFLTQTSWPITVGEYFSRLGVPSLTDQSAQLLRTMDLEPGLPGHEHGAELRAAFWRLEEPLIAAAAEERARLVAYWEESGFLQSPRPAIVDIGWHGSLQHAIGRALGLEGLARTVGGLYFGLHETRPSFGGQPMEAFVDGSVNGDLQLYRDLVRGSVAPLEFCFTRPEGTVVGLSAGTSPSGSRATPRFEARTAPDRLDAVDSEILEQIQRGAVDFVTDFRRAVTDLPGTVAVLERDVTTESMVMMLSDPSAAAAAILGGRHHADGFGSGVTWELIGAPSGTASSYQADPERLANEYARSSWRAGFRANARALGFEVA